MASAVALLPSSDQNDSGAVVPAQNNNRVQPSNAAPKWWEDTSDSDILDQAKSACVRLRADLHKLAENDDQDLLTSTNAKSLVSLIRFHQENIESENGKPGLGTQIVQRLETFCVFADKVSAVVAVMVPQDPKFTIPFGCLALLFKAVALNKERQEKLDAFMVKIVDLLPVAEAYAELYSTRHIKETVAQMFVTVLEFLGKATLYFRRNNLKKAVDLLFKMTSSKFDVYIKRLQDSKERLAQYQTLAAAAQQDETLRSVQEIGGTTNLIYRELEIMSEGISQRLTALEGAIETERSLSYKDRNLVANDKVSTLAEILFPDSNHWETELTIAKSGLQELSQKVHQQKHIAIEDLSRWATTVDYCPLLWLSVASGNQGSWVTHMTAEYQETWTQGDIQLICIFAGIYQSPRLTMRDIVRLLIIRILEKFPLVVFDIPEVLNTRRLRNASVPVLWSVLDAMVEKLDPMLIIIDRIDCCENGQSEDWEKFLKNIGRLVLGHERKLRVIFTSAQEVPRLAQQAEGFEIIQSSARIRPARRYDR